MPKIGRHLGVSGDLEEAPVEEEPAPAAEPDIEESEEAEEGPTRPADYANKATWQAYVEELGGAPGDRTVAELKDYAAWLEENGPDEEAADPNDEVVNEEEPGAEDEPEGGTV